MKKSKYDIIRTVEVEEWGTITAKAGTLNSISYVLSEAANFDREQERNFTADLRDRQSQQIYDALAATGFYKD